MRAEENKWLQLSRISNIGGLGFGVLFSLVFFGSLVWAHSGDPFLRTDLVAQSTSGHKVHGITVLPANFQNGPVIVYAHRAGSSWMDEGNNLRQFAELGLVAVGFDFDQTNSGSFDGEFSAVLDYVHRQPWANTNPVAWLGFSLGAQNTLRYLIKHPKDQPQLYVRLAGGWIPELDREFMVHSPKWNVSVLLVHGENDETFPVEDTKRLTGFLRTNGTDVVLRVVPGHGHAFEADQAVVFRLVAEYCKAKLTPQHPWPEFPKLRPYPFLLCIAPAFFWLAFCFYLRRKNRGGTTPNVPLTKFEIGLRATAVVLGTLAVADTALHLIPPRMEVTPQTLEIARKCLLAPKWHQDFETLAAMPIWQGQRLQTLLTHMELANYTVYELVNWKVGEALYRKYVLSPVIIGDERELKWRRELWENFYPRVRHENTTSDAAGIVVRFLRQRVTIASGYPKQPGVESMWNGHIVNVEDFEVLYTAALRSVGVPARLDTSRQAEFWTGQAWQSAPRPLATTWVE